MINGNIDAGTCRRNIYICLMMVTDTLIDKLADLSMLEFSGEEKSELKVELEKMIGFINKLNELDTTGIQPLLHMSPNADISREDVVAGQISKENAFRNAPLHDDAFFKVPKVIQKNQNS